MSFCSDNSHSDEAKGYPCDVNLEGDFLSEAIPFFPCVLDWRVSVSFPFLGLCLLVASLVLPVHWVALVRVRLLMAFLGLLGFPWESLKTYPVASKNWILPADSLDGLGTGRWSLGSVVAQRFSSGFILSNLNLTQRPQTSCSFKQRGQPEYSIFLATRNASPSGASSSSQEPGRGIDVCY